MIAISQKTITTSVIVCVPASAVARRGLIAVFVPRLPVAGKVFALPALGADDRLHQQARVVKLPDCFSVPDGASTR